LGEITIDDVVGLREELDDIRNNSGGSGTVDYALSTESENPVQNKVIANALANAGDRSFAVPFMFAGFTSFPPIAFGRKVRIDSVIKDERITSIRAGKNDATPQEIDTQLPLTIEADDKMVFEVTYNQDMANSFTLKGIKL
jgi:hypothetical protein